MRLLEDVLAEEILSGRVSEGDTALVDVNEEGKVTVQPVKDRELLAQGAE
jgi:ATP-dependent Clp protease ATP-binding subunit ClpC